MDPLSIAGLLATLFSTVAQSHAADQVQQQRESVQAAERLRQSTLDSQRKAAIDATLPKFSPQQQQADQQSIADNLRSTLTPQTLPASNASYLPGNPGAPQAVGDSLTARLSDALAKGKDYAKNLANVNSYGRLNFGNATTLNRLGEQTGQINSSSANSAGILPLELQAAPLAGRTSAQVGDIAGGLGNLLFLGGITRKPAAAPTPSKDWPMP